MAELRIAALFCLLLIMGCGDQPTGYLPVSGSVKTKAGEGCAGAMVVFHPVAGNQTTRKKSIATCDEHGAFELTTTRLGDGALAGEYVVTVVWYRQQENDPSVLSETSKGPDLLSGRYENPKSSELTAIVTQGGENCFDFVVE